ncbi:MAG: PAS domain S-box protein [Syntrophales bacterium]|nr:PAS domain S-box protein [Syntrophales bacterium]
MEVKAPHATGHEFSDKYEQLYTMLLDAIPSSVLLIDQNMRIVSANRNFLEKGQRSLANTIGYKLEEVFPTVILDQMAIARRIRNVIEKNQPAKGERMTYRAPGVPIRIYYYSLLPVSWQEKVEGVILLMDDVTEQVRLGEEVRRVERHLASIVESASDLILSADKKGAILTWNAAAERLSGYAAAEAQGRYFPEFFADEDQKDIREIFSFIDTGKYAQTKECPLKTGQGSFVPVSWVFSPLKDTANQTAGIVAVGRDLSERRKLEMELIQTQKLAALGVMAGGIAHEIRNPLAICSSAAQFLLEEDNTPEFRRECAEKIHQGIQRTSIIIENLLKYSHPSTTSKMTLVNLVSLISETLTLVAYHAKIFKIEVQSSFPRESIMVQGMATLLQQVFMNLFLNAINAMPSGGRLGIDVRKVNSEVWVQVTDTGFGIEKNEIEKIFDPFYTTSTVGKGTGLGLSICYSIVVQHKGAIEVESAKGQGSVFTVKLPARYGGGEP